MHGIKNKQNKRTWRLGGFQNVGKSVGDKGRGNVTQGRDFSVIPAPWRWRDSLRVLHIFVCTRLLCFRCCYLSLFECSSQVKSFHPRPSGYSEFWGAERDFCTDYIVKKEMNTLESLFISIYTEVIFKYEGYDICFFFLIFKDGSNQLLLVILVSI